jgi:nucleotide-binding universal stress UspA family protein
MALFQKIIHPTDFDVPSKEAFRIARSLAQALNTEIVAFHVVAPPAVLTPDGRVLFDSNATEPIDLWQDYRMFQKETPGVSVQYAAVVGDMKDAKHMLEQKIRDLGEEVLVVIGSHGRTGLSRFLWGSKAEELMRDLSCPVLVVKGLPTSTPAATHAPESVSA